MKTLQEIFPRASKSFFDSNPATLAPETNKNTLQVTEGGKKRGSINKTEQEFSLILEAQKRKGEILRWEYEGITLRFAGVKYTPDFFVITHAEQFTASSGGYCNPAEIKFIEIKGPFIKGKFERAIERFRHAKTYWPEFQFELHQKTKEGWKQILW